MFVTSEGPGLSGPGGRTYGGPCEPGADVPRGTKVEPALCTLEGGYSAAHPCRSRGRRRARDRCARDSCPSVRVLSRSVSSSVRTSGASAKTCDVRHPWPCPIE